MYIFDLALSILRLLIYGTFYKQARNTFRFYYIWPPAIVTWTLDGLCFYYSSSSISIIDDKYQVLTSVPYHAELLQLKAALTWFAVAMFYTQLDLYKEADDDSDDDFITDRATRRRYYNSIKSPLVVDLFSLFEKCIIPTIIITVVNAASDHFGGARLQHSTYNNPIPYKSFSTIITDVITVAFLINIWWRFKKTGPATSSSSSPLPARSNPALLMYGCFITLNPIHTIFEIVVLSFRDLIFSIARIDAPLTFVSSFILTMETVLMAPSVLLKKDRLADWPKFKTVTLTQKQVNPNINDRKTSTNLDRASFTK
ncbi:hypothetical protein BDB00DRAFT_812153 [Zychaea mexicana]|uniref:uncharacterized protein n=1 Tax=Zychaea mexicana TaxID=64656 RepID=UPI0022FE578B|nr:uncharacterized protein BDB00DRAFT_812153 [Zychaea mexicana]KAI9495840.1 hypothetical protein BDB00DRAFT_812153 [Zychaea mexicana]